LNHLVAVAEGSQFFVHDLGKYVRIMGRRGRLKNTSSSYVFEQETQSLSVIERRGQPQRYH
jgi:hypothetical protein